MIVDVTVEAADPGPAFELSRALRDPHVHVRESLAHRGYAPGMVCYIDDTPIDPGDPRPAFRAWRDDAVPGGWTGEVVY